MVSNIALIVFIAALVIIAGFSAWSIKRNWQTSLLHRLFLFFEWAIASWIIPVILIRLLKGQSNDVMFVLDCIMQPGGALCSPLYLCIAVTFIKGYDKMQRWMKALFIVPVITILISFTNPLHHLMYNQFSVIRSEIVFGPYILISGTCNYIYLIAAIVYILLFAFKNKTALYWKQCTLFALSGLCPLLISFVATFGGIEMPISATPMSFLATVAFCGIAIYQLHMLDITPIATKHILDGISDCYLVLSEKGLVLNYNKQFEQLFAAEYGITENKALKDCVKKEDIHMKTPIYNMITAIAASKDGETQISYEQAVTVNIEGRSRKKYFVVDVSPLEVYGKISGFAVLFKDITQVKESMQKLQDSQERMLEQERMAFLGQMIGGLAHNLKTPIMSISGCIAAATDLVEECEESLEDPQVTEEDFREIYTEMKDWFQKVKDSTAYMSDIITAIKGQAANISTDEKLLFTLDEMLKRSMLLMRHEILNSGCQINVQYDQTKTISLQGDINNLIQVVDNLLSNAIFVQKEAGGGKIDVEVYTDAEHLQIAIKDRGKGVSANVKEKLFKNMVTSKGTKGTGLGLYISSIVIKGKFGGHLWHEDREGGGSVFGIAIPLDRVQIK